MKQTASYRNILKALSLFTGVQGLNILLNIVRAKLAAVLLGPTGIGLNGIFNEVRELIHESTNLGLDKSGVREVARAYGAMGTQDDDRQLRSAIMLTRSWVMLFAVLGSLVTLVLAQPLSWIFFDDGAHANGFMLLSPAVGLSTITCGELIVLRGIRRLKTIAQVSVLHVIAGIATTIPVYFYWGIDGVVPALVLMTLTAAVIAIVYSYRLHRPEFCFRPNFLKGGTRMLIIGTSFVLSGIIAHGSRLIIHSYLNRYSSLETVGYFTQILSIMGYVSTVFASLDTDYFPRLSSSFEDKSARLRTVERQIEVTGAVMLPIVVALIFMLPYLVPLLLSDDFTAIVPAAQILALSLLCRTLHLPSAIMPLAAGDSRMYLALQFVSYLNYIPAVIIGHSMLGIAGIGVGLAVNNTLDAICSLTCARYRYGFVPGRTILTQFLGSTLLAGTAYAMACTIEGVPCMIAAAAMITLSVAVGGTRLKRFIRKDNDE